MDFYKLREWVGTMTGKGDRWGRNRLGRSEPAFLSASTTALPPSTCTARREAGQLCGQLLLCCEAGQLLAVVVFEACAGRRVRRLCLPAVPCSAGFLFACCQFCLPCPLPFISSCPRSSLLCPRSFHFCCACPRSCPCAPGSSRKLLTVLLAAATRACSGGPCAGSI